MDEIRLIGEHEFTITPQVWYDAWMMSLPEFVTYYTITSQFSDRHDLGFSFRELFFELRDRITIEGTVNRDLKKSQLRVWLAERGLTLKDVETDSAKLYTAKKTKQINGLTEANPLVEKGMPHAKNWRPKDTPQSTTIEEDSIQEVEDEEVVPEVQKQSIEQPTTAGSSRLDQVRELMKQGINSPSEIAKILGTNPSYIHRLKKQVNDESSANLD